MLTTIEIRNYRLSRQNRPIIRLNSNFELVRRVLLGCHLFQVGLVQQA